MARIAAAVCEAAPQINPDDLELQRRLVERGIAMEPAVWSDLGVDWTRFDAVLIRSTWDYHKRYGEFLQWLARLEAAGTPTINALPLLRWNSDKRYLLTLAAAGVDVIPTRIACPADVPSAAAALRANEVVIKPAVSAGAWSTYRCVAGSDELLRITRTLPADLELLVQPFVPEITSMGEWSLLFFAGEFSHAVRKLPASGDYRVQREFGGGSERATPPPVAIECGRRALALLAGLGFEVPAYARVDGVCSQGRFLLMELELIEPFLFLCEAPDASERLADAVSGALGRARSSVEKTSADS